MAAILMSIVAQYGMSGVFAAAVLAGILLILAGVFHLGRVTAYLPMPVITGFTCGIAVVIALGQVGNFFRYSLQREYLSGKTARLADGRHLPNQSRRAGARVFCGAVHGVLSEALEQRGSSFAGVYYFSDSARAVRFSGCGARGRNFHNALTAGALQLFRAEF